MAINNWANVTVGGAAANQPDRQDHRHTAVPAAADGGDFTVAWDSAKVTRMTLWDSAAAAARQVALSRLPP